jgi:hypothetical protein
MRGQSDAETNATKNTVDLRYMYEFVNTAIASFYVMRKVHEGGEKTVNRKFLNVDWRY